MPETSITWVDGELATALPLPDRGLDFGDGVFETLLLRYGQPLYPDLHVARLIQGLRSLAFPDCLAAVSDYLTPVANGLEEAAWPWAALRITVTRGSAPRGYAIPENCTPRIVMTATRLDRDCAKPMAPAALSVATVHCSDQPALAGVKHLNRLEQVMAASEAQAAGADEAVLLGTDSRVVSVSSGNLFAVHDKTLYTPPVDRCGIAGTRRRLILERWAGQLGLAVKEIELQLSDLETADEIFYCNSLIGLRPVRALGATEWWEYEVCLRLFEQYRAELP